MQSPRNGSLPEGKSLRILLIKPSKLGGESKHTAILCLTTGALCCSFGIGFLLIHCIGFDLRQLRPEGGNLNPEVERTAQAPSENVERAGPGEKIPSVWAGKCLAATSLLIAGLECVNK